MRQRSHSALRAALACLFGLLAGCGNAGPDKSAERDGGRAAPAGSTTSAVAPASRDTVTEGSVEARGTGSVRFTVVLPGPLQDRSPLKDVREYARSKDERNETGPVIRVHGWPKGREMSLAVLLADAQRQKATVLKKEQLDGGFFVAIHFEKEKAVSLIGSKGGSLYFVSYLKGDAAMADRQGSVATLEKTFRSLTIMK